MGTSATENPEAGLPTGSARVEVVAAALALIAEVDNLFQCDLDGHGPNITAPCAICEQMGRLAEAAERARATLTTQVGTPDLETPPAMKFNNTFPVDAENIVG